MNLLFHLLFSGVVVEAEGGKGNSISFTLILILIIVILVTVLLIRDKKIRDKVKRFFKLIGRKIKNSRINSKIEKEEKDLSGFIAKLGMKGFENKLYPDNSEEIIESIIKEKETIKKFDTVLSDMEKKIADLKSEHDIFVSLKKSDIENGEKIKEPVEKRCKELSRMISDLKKESEDNGKKINRANRGIEKCEAELDRLMKDDLLDPEERQGRKEREEKSLAELKEELSDRRMREAAIPGELSILEKEEADQRLKLDVLEKNLSKLEKEFKDSEKKHDDKIGELVKEKGHFTAEKTRSNYTLTDIYGKLGKIYDRERPENRDISVIYIDIDRSRERIKDLRSQLT